MSVYMYLKINALGDYKKKYDPFARLLALKRGVGVCSVVGVVSGFYGTCTVTCCKTLVGNVKKELLLGQANRSCLA